MKNPTRPLTRANHATRCTAQPGLAIVVVVSLMALLMLLVLAFLLTSSTNRNIASTDTAIRQADSIADLAKETIVADLIGEMKDGSTTASKGQKADGTYAFDIEIPKAIVPSRAVNASVKSDDKLNLIVKQSASGVKFSSVGSSTAVQRASDISTSEKDLDGRKVAEARWSAPKFLPPGLNLDASQVPTWVYTTRSGGNPTHFEAKNNLSTKPSGEPNPDYVVGRYAVSVLDSSPLMWHMNPVVVRRLLRRWSALRP